MGELGNILDYYDSVSSELKQRFAHDYAKLTGRICENPLQFANVVDGNDAGAIEYVYSLMAKNAGVKMTHTHLFPATSGAGYFATKRFDRTKDQHLHTHKQVDCYILIEKDCSRYKGSFTSIL